MPWAADHKQKTRLQILDSASQLFTKHGYDKISINQVMQHAGLTRGAFYKHFSSKTDLYSEAILFGTRKAAKERLKHATDVSQLIAAYTSPEHVSGEGDVCPLAFLVSDISQQDGALKEVYGKVLNGFIDVIAQHADKDRETAVLGTILMIGSVALGRAVADPALSNEILTLAREAALEKMVGNDIAKAS